MNAYTEHAEGVRSLQDELGDDCPLIWYAGRAIKVLPAVARVGSNNTIGGQSLDSDFSFVALAADFPQPPASNQLFKYPGANGKLFRIDNVFTAPGSAQIRISANDASQGI